MPFDDAKLTDITKKSSVYLKSIFFIHDQIFTLSVYRTKEIMHEKCMENASKTDFNFKSLITKIVESLG